MIVKALLRLGYTEFVVRGDTYEGIEWIEQPEVVPSRQDIENAIVAEQVEQDAKAAAKESAKAKLAALGLTEEEVNAILGGI